jgi:uncharacterized membrane protein YbhN (UPF0104 family)
VHGLPDEFAPRRLARRLGLVVVLLAALVLAAVLAPGLGEVKRRLGDASPGWLALAVVLEALSCASYVLMFRPVFCAHLPVRETTEIALAELAVGSLVPTSGASGVAFGAWILHREGMPDDAIARRSVAFLEIKSAVNFVAVAILGVLMAAGLGPPRSLLLTALPAALSIAFLAAAAMLSRLGPGEDPGPGAAWTRRALHAARDALGTGTEEALALLRRHDWKLLAGAIGYWAFDNAVLWATFKAVGADVPLTVIAMGYLIGQLGGVLPLPAGIGGIDGGLLGALVVYGAPAAETAAAVLAYRIILFWLPLLAGGAAFALLLRRLDAESAAKTRER